MLRVLLTTCANLVRKSFALARHDGFQDLLTLNIKLVRKDPIFGIATPGCPFCQPRNKQLIEAYSLFVRHIRSFAITMTDSQIHGTRAATGARAATGSQDQTPQPPHAPPAPPGLGNALNANIHPGSKLTISLNIRPLPARGDDELVGVGAMFDDQTAEADDRDFGTELRI